MAHTALRTDCEAISILGSPQRLLQRQASENNSLHQKKRSTSSLGQVLIQISKQVAHTQGQIAPQSPARISPQNPAKTGVIKQFTTPQKRLLLLQNRSSVPRTKWHIRSSENRLQSNLQLLGSPHNPAKFALKACTTQKSLLKFTASSEQVLLQIKLDTLPTSNHPCKGAAKSFLFQHYTDYRYSLAAARGFL